MTVKPETDAMHVIVNGHDVTDHIRTPEVSARVSAVSALAGVRAAMVEIQRRQAAKGGIVLDGRDIGTTVLPHADVKIFLTASVHRNDGKESGHDFGRGGKRYPEKGLAGQPS